MHIHMSDNTKAPPSQVNSLSVLQFDSNRQTCAHMHDFLEIGFVISGKGIYSLTGIDYEISAGDLIVALPGDMHYESGSAAEHIEILFLGIQIPCTLDHKTDIPFDSSRIIHTKSLPEIHQLLRNILIESLEQKDMYERIIEAEVSKLLVLLKRITAGSLRKHYSEESLSDLIKLRKLKVVSQIKDYLENNFSQNINLGDAARKFYISPQHLARLFKETTGCTPKQYITSLRIESAREQLVNTRDTILSIAQNLGYDNIHYFYRIFRKETGCTPMQYRAANSLLPESRQE